MTEVSSLLGTNHKITSERHYEAGPPPGLELVEPGETFATTKEEEWVSKKTTEVTNTKQIETRVKRQVVLEDGKVVEDSGPMVSTNTTEDTEKQEHHQTELRKLGDDDDKEKTALEGVGFRDALDTVDGKEMRMVPVANPDGIVREVKQKKVVSRKETEETKETEDVHHYGNITDDEFLAAVNSGRKDLREVLRTRHSGQEIVSTGPRLIKETSKSNQVTDTEETRELSSVRADGRIVTETQRTTEHEEVKDEELPENLPEQNSHKESHERYYKSREQEDVDYIADGVKIGHEMRYRAETTEADRHGDEDMDDPDWDSLSARARRRQNGTKITKSKGVDTSGIVISTASPLDRKDALTKKPLNFDQEEETRKVETSKWLEHHFGSESRSSRDSMDDIEEENVKKSSSSFFNVTIKSQTTPDSEVNAPQNERTYSRISQRNFIEDELHSRYQQGANTWSYDHREQRRVHSPPRNLDFDYPDRYRSSPIRDFHKSSPVRESTPTPPQRKRATERRAQRIMQEPVEEPPPDYSPTTPTRDIPCSKKSQQKTTRFATDPPTSSSNQTNKKSGNIIGQSIRKLVGKIRSASAERKARQQREKMQKNERSPSPSYKQGHVIDNIHEPVQNGRRTASPGPVHRYYLGEDPFGGSMYGREDKYEAVRVGKSSNRIEQPRYIQPPEEYRSQSTLGRFSKSTGRLAPSDRRQPHHRDFQSLPRHPKQNTINVSIINKPLSNGAPAKPARTYRHNLSRSKSFSVDLEEPINLHPTMTSTHLSSERTGLKSPGLISSISRSQRDLSMDHTTRFPSRNGLSDGFTSGTSTKKVFMKDLRQRAPELYSTLHEADSREEDSWRSSPIAYSTPTKTVRISNGYDMYEPPTRLVDTHNKSYAPSRAVIRRGSSSSTDFSETYHTTTRNDDPRHPTVTDTVKSYSKKTLPSRDGRRFETVESTETKSVTKSQRGQQANNYHRNGGVNIAVKNYRNHSYN